MSVHAVAAEVAYKIAPIICKKPARSATSPNHAASYNNEGTCRAWDAWAPPSLAGSTNAVAYFITASTVNDRIIAARSPVAKTLELHTHIKEGNVLRMRRVKRVAVPANRTVVFEPGGLHIMLFNLTQPLNDGDQFPLTVTYEKGGEVTVDVRISHARLLQHMKSRMSGAN